MPLMQILKWEDTPSICAKLSVGGLYKDMEEGGFHYLPANPHLASTSLPFLALEPTSLKFQHILKKF